MARYFDEDFVGWRLAASVTGSLKPYSLYSDVRIKLFARVFALGTISHELEFLLEQARIGPLTEYLERWSRVIPSIDWPSQVGLALHFANVAISLLILLLPWDRELLCLLAGTFLFSELASPERIASHCSMMAGGLLVTFILGLAEWTERALGRQQSVSAETEWYAWTLVGLKSICALTYFFAFFYKLNPNWFIGSAPSFLIKPFEPFLYLLGLPDSYRLMLAPISIYGALTVELSLPILLLVRRTRLLGCLIGLVFSLGMIAQGVANFPVLAVAFYSAFLTLEQAQELVDRCRARPGIARIVATVIFAAVWFIQREPKANWMYHERGLPALLMATYSSLAFACFVLLIYVAVTIAGQLSERKPETGTALSGVGERSAEPSQEVADSSCPRAARAVAVGAVFLVSAAFVYNNLAGFLALPAAGAMIMFSGISPDLSNHFLLHRTPLSGSYDYVSVTQLESTDSESPAFEEFRSFTSSLRRQPHLYQVNLNLVRYHMSRLCKSPLKPAVRLTLQTRAGETLDFNNVCAAPEMLWYTPLPVASACNPGCNGELRRRARGHVDQPTLKPAGRS